MALSLLKLTYASPEINPLSLKAKSIPVLNPYDKYGRVFFFSWVGFLVAFLSWYAFPPLMTITIRQDLNMSQADIANSNVVALLATLVVRAMCGPLCDRFGPRWVFIGTLLCGAVPTAMTGLVTTPSGLIALRFFVGILGATFVPCQVWCTGFFDKNVVGSANAMAGGFGNAGGGITYFVMPAIFDSLVRQQGIETHKAWRIAYIVPFVIIVAVALAMAFVCDDTPSGRWSDRHRGVANGRGGERQGNAPFSGVPSNATRASSATDLSQSDLEKGGNESDGEAEQRVTYPSGVEGEIVKTLTFWAALSVMFSKESLALAGPYACSLGTINPCHLLFAQKESSNKGNSGSELAINSILGSYYFQTFPSLGQTHSGHWAAMMGLLNVVFRPLGGFIADMIYKHTNSVWAKKVWLVFLGLSFSVFLIAIGLANPNSQATLFGLVTGYAFFRAAANGANFAVVPHVHPSANGIVSGIVGSFGNLGGILFAIVFRYNDINYHRSLWIIGAICMVVNLAVSWIAPIPTGQVGGR